ncbi:hypothetical protein BDN67DRAFT_972035 [Paxillus ammoniavirescens]|nr:hypothetical protein BDN67DRAFT_972035 [Paxillus ammoniavirescens]
MLDESPPPYDAVVGPVVQTLGQLATATPFSFSPHFISEIHGLVSEGKSLDSRFKDIHDIVSAVAAFEHQEPALVLSQTMNTLLWDSRHVAGVVLAALKEFNENILDFLSDPNASAQDRLDELVGVWKVVQEKRQPTIDQKPAFGRLLTDLTVFRRTIHGALAPKRKRQNHHVGKSRDVRPKRGASPPLVMPHSEPSGSLSLVSTCGTAWNTCTNFALHVERMAEDAMWSSFSSVTPPLGPEQTQPIAHKKPVRNRPKPTVDIGQLAILPVRLDALLRDLRGFAERIGIFHTLLNELEREHDIFVVYLKDGQSVTHLGYRSEINRLRKHLPRICHALNAYSRARDS